MEKRSNISSAVAAAVSDAMRDKQSHLLPLVAERFAIAETLYPVIVDGHGHYILNLEHYLDVLKKKSGAMKSSTPLQQWRAAGRWPMYGYALAATGKPPR